MWVFPGGQVDEADRLDATGGRARLDAADRLDADPTSHPTPRSSSGGPDQVEVARYAAVREAREEAGINLDVDGLAVLSFWLPPPEAPRRFATWFFLARVDPDAAVEVDDAEIREFRWLTPQAAMAARNSSSMGMAPPTYMTLWWLATHGDTASALAAAMAGPVETFETRMLSARGDAPQAALWAGDAAFQDGDLGRPGPRRRLVMSEPHWVVEVTSA
jgi:8-oxo-dGTP pyrophosphatase MutT (NUDIX family)